MITKESKLLVVDASVACSAGETRHPVSSACRERLIEILKICHRIIMTPSIRQEWNEHESKFSRKWRMAMVARKKLCAQNDVPIEMPANITTVLSEKEYEALHKDIHLVSAACQGDGIIITGDEEIIRVWNGCCSCFKLAKAIHIYSYNTSIDDIS